VIVPRGTAVEIARTWIGTPYVRAGRIKGAGVDCGTLLSENLLGIEKCGPVEMDQLIRDLGFLSNDWFCHAAADKYEQALRKFAPLKWKGICRGHDIPALPGDLVLFKVVSSTLYNHGAIVTQWPRCIHAVHPRVAEMRATLHPMTAFTEMAIFDPWGADAMIFDQMLQPSSWGETVEAGKSPCAPISKEAAAAWTEYLKTTKKRLR
jgi:cell wall-associated NlpC family hydrolase